MDMSHHHANHGLILSYAALVGWRTVVLKNAQKRLSHLQRMTCLGITGDMRSSVMPHFHLFIKQDLASCLC
jgi:hypothetical protein